MNMRRAGWGVGFRKVPFGCHLNDPNDSNDPNGSNDPND